MNIGVESHSLQMKEMKTHIATELTIEFEEFIKAVIRAHFSMSGVNGPMLAYG